MRRLFMLAVLAFIVTSCSENDDGRLEITGTVKLKGNPIKNGAIIQFFPEENQGTEGLVTTAAGAFTLPKANGLKAGKYKVSVSLGDGQTAVNPVNDGTPPGPGGGANIISKELVPPDWNRNSTQFVTVTKGGPNKFDFDIP